MNTQSTPNCSNLYNYTSIYNMLCILIDSIAKFHVYTVSYSGFSLWYKAVSQVQNSNVNFIHSVILCTLSRQSLPVAFLSNVTSCSVLSRRLTMYVFVEGMTPGRHDTAELILACNISCTVKLVVNGLQTFASSRKISTDKRSDGFYYQY